VELDLEDSAVDKDVFPVEIRIVCNSHSFLSSQQDLPFGESGALVASIYMRRVS
jgi:hypothetical protein